MTNEQKPALYPDGSVIKDEHVEYLARLIDPEAFKFAVAFDEAVRDRARMSARRVIAAGPRSHHGTPRAYADMTPEERAARIMDVLDRGADEIARLRATLAAVEAERDALAAMTKREAKTLIDRIHANVDLSRRLPRDQAEVHSLKAMADLNALWAQIKATGEAA